MISNDIVNLINNKNKNKNLFLYNFLECVLRIIDIEVNIFDKSDIINYVNIFRNKLATDLIENFYKKLDYNLKIDRNEIYTKLIHNKTLDENTKKYISYYINLNIIVINNLKYRYLNNYDKDKNSIIMIEKNNKYHPIYLIKNDKHYNIFRNVFLIEVLGNFNLDNRLIFNNNSEMSDDDYKKINKLKNNKLGILQKICGDYDICIFKYIDTKKIYKKKLELFEEIKLKITNKMI